MRYSILGSIICFVALACEVESFRKTVACSLGSPEWETQLVSLDITVITEEDMIIVEKEKCPFGSNATYMFVGLRVNLQPND